MRVEDFLSDQRRYVRRTTQGHLAFFPPTVRRAVPLHAEIVAALSDADRALGELSGVGLRLRNPRMLIRPYLHREALLSSRIEGTQSSMAELLLFEADAPTTRPDQAREVVNYVQALEWGISELPRLPISLRMVLGLHKRLLAGVRGERYTPGAFRTAQNWVAPEGTPIERAVFVPPPPDQLPELLDDWEKYVHESDRTPPLIRCALMHYQFETVHPFRDGNGRLGRLLMPLFLIERACLSQPLLYLSAYFERQRDAYYEALMRGRTRGDLRSWLLLFLDAVKTQARDASARGDKLTHLESDFRRRIRDSRSKVVHALIDEIFSGLFVTAARVAKKHRVTAVSARAAIETLVRAGVLTEMTGRSYGRVYASREMLAIVDAPEARPDRRRSEARVGTGPG